MKAVLRLGIAIAASWLALGQATALAQSSPPPPATTDAPPKDTVGPRELQNFSLQGTVTRPDGSPPAAQAPRQAVVARSEPAPASDQAPGRPLRSARIAQARAEPVAPAAPSSVQPSATVPTSESAAAISAAPATLPAVPNASPVSLAPERTFPIWPWLLAALGLGVAAAFLFWRRRPREAYAAGPQVDEFVAPEPEPRPSVPLPPPASPPVPREQTAGFVSSRMRPRIEIGFEPARCIVGEHDVTLEFAIELFNSGNAQARDVLLEVSFFNAGATQEQEIGGFFDRPVGEGERIVIPPLQRVSLRPRLTVAIDQIRLLEAAGRKVFVPLIAFNALYGWGGGGDGQTSAAYLIGRNTKGTKLAPFRLDLGPRVFRGLDARALPLSVQR